MFRESSAPRRCEPLPDVISIFLRNEGIEMSTNAAGKNDQSTGAGSHQVLTFVLGNETYGVDILRVQEIRGWSAVTKIPHAPSHVLGVLNLRGSIVPIVDLR